MREKLPDTRRSTTRRFAIPRPDNGPLELEAVVGVYDDGRPGEIFLQADRAGSIERGLLNALGVAVSIGLQHGVPLGAFTRQFRDMRFEPAGFTGDPEIKSCTSVLDYMAKWLEKRFGNGAGAAGNGAKNGEVKK